MVVPHPVQRLANSAVRNARAASLGLRGAKMFNLLPVGVRTLNGVSVDRFKSELDKFLSIVPDQPTCPGRPSAVVTKSLLDQLQHIF